MKTTLATSFAFALAWTILSPHALAAPASSANPALRFTPCDTNGFAFDTGVLRGSLREQGHSQGLSSVVYVPTGARLDSSMGFIGHYRQFSANHRYGTGAWYWPSEASLQPDGSVAVIWPATKDRPFELRALYRWATPNALDVETSVLAKTNLTNFESFLASYFSPDFTNSRVYVRELPGQPGVKGFLAAEPSAGHWLAFPRDHAALALFRDGRWTYPPSPVDWVAMPPLAQPLGMRRSPATGLTAVLMAPPAECFAVCTPCQTDSHYSMYLSLFGRDLKEGETARARARLLIAPRLTEAEVLKAYEEYLQTLPARRR
jgi:hypothetical protein